MARVDGTWTAAEISHTADVGFEVDAPTWAVLLERAGLVVAGTIVDLATVTPREDDAISVTAPGRVELLHDWLHAVLVRVQAGGFVPCEIVAAVAEPDRIEAALRGERLDLSRHVVRGEVKAITWHGLAVEETATGLRARVILDV